MIVRLLAMIAVFVALGCSSGQNEVEQFAGRYCRYVTSGEHDKISSLIYPPDLKDFRDAVLSQYGVTRPGRSLSVGEQLLGPKDQLANLSDRKVYSMWMEALSDGLFISPSQKAGHYAVLKVLNVKTQEWSVVTTLDGMVQDIRATSPVFMIEEIEGRLWVRVRLTLFPVVPKPGSADLIPAGNSNNQSGCNVFTPSGPENKVD